MITSVVAAVSIEALANSDHQAVLVLRRSLRTLTTSHREAFLALRESTVSLALHIEKLGSTGDLID
jgi:hypothetical protein